MNEFSDKNILVFYPHNFFEMSSGTHRRFHDLAEYFKDRVITADLISIDGFTNAWDAESLNKAKSFFSEVHTCKWRPRLYSRLQKYSPSFRQRNLYDFATDELRSKLRELLAAKRYGFFLNSYVFWEKFADDVPFDTVKIIDLHDFITLNEYMRSGRRDFKLGSMFEQEINAINKYDYALSISAEETLMLQPFCSHAKLVTLPVSFEEKFQDNTQDFKYDTMFIGSDNPSNEKGIRWFMSAVYPLLPETVRIAVVGGVSRFAANKTNVTAIPHVDDLDDIYRSTKSVFCPLLDGTGLKVKIVEALSYGKPIVTTKWGLAGILQKEDTGCILADDPAEFARAIQILVTDQEHFRSVAKMSKQFFLRQFTRNACWGQLDTLFRSRGFNASEAPLDGP